MNLTLLLNKYTWNLLSQLEMISIISMGKCVPKLKTLHTCTRKVKLRIYLSQSIGCNNNLSQFHNIKTFSFDKMITNLIATTEQLKFGIIVNFPLMIWSSIHWDIMQSISELPLIIQHFVMLNQSLQLSDFCQNGFLFHYFDTFDKPTVW